MLRWCASAGDGIKFKCVPENPRQFWDSNFAPYEFRQYSRGINKSKVRQKCFTA